MRTCHINSKSSLCVDTKRQCPWVNNICSTLHVKPLVVFLVACLPRSTPFCASLLAGGFWSATCVTSTQDLNLFCSLYHLLAIGCPEQRRNPRIRPTPALQTAGGYMCLPSVHLPLVGPRVQRKERLHEDSFASISSCTLSSNVGKPFTSPSLLPILLAFSLQRFQRRCCLLAFVREVKTIPSPYYRRRPNTWGQKHPSFMTDQLRCSLFISVGQQYVFLLCFQMKWDCGRFVFALSARLE